MKAILSIIISAALVVSGYSQTRNVLVGTNNSVVQPTNFWSADASNARTGLGLGTAATNPASAFQPSSATLSNLASSNAVNLTNLRATNLVGVIPSSNIPSTTLTNISGTLAIVSGGTGATNASNARVNLGATTVGNNLFTATNAEAARTAIGALATNGDAAGLTNFPTVALASNVTGTVAVTNGGTGATNAAMARTNLGLGSISSNSFNITNSAIYTLTNFVVTNGVAFFGGGGSYFATFESTNTGFASFIGGVGYFHNGTNIWYVNTNGLEFNSPSVVRSNLGLPLAALTNTNASNFRTAIGATTIGHSLFTATNSAAAIDAIGLSTNFSDQVLSVSNIFIGAFPSGSAVGFVVPTSGRTLQIAGTNVSTAVPAFFGWNGFIQTAFSAAEARTNLGLNAWTTNTNSPVFVGTNGEVVSPTNFWQVAPISTTVQYQTNVTGTSTNVATNSRNLFLFSLAPSVSGVTNTVTLPTNAATTFDGDRATIIHLATNSANAVTAIRQLGAATNLITLNQVDEAVLLMYRGGQWRLADNLSFIEPIYFSGTNASANAAASRTNLGLGANAAVAFGSLVLGTATDQLELISETTNSFELNYRTNGIAASSITFDSSQIVFNKPINFDSTNTVATTRANLGLGTNSAVVFASVNASLDTGDSNGIVFQSKIDFDDVRSENIVEKTRTNLGLGATWLTNTNVTNFRTDIGLGGTNNVTFSNITASGTLTTTSTVTAKTNLVVEGFVDFTTNHTNATPVTPNTPAIWLQIRVGTNVFYLPAHQ